jgi:CDP-glycerol glycerophosphotransferase
VLVSKLRASIKYITLGDVYDIITLIVYLPIALIYKLYLNLRGKKLWVFSEGMESARDNAFCLYQYTRKTHPSLNAYYAIDKKSKDFLQVKPYGNIINYGSMKHWVFYLSATKNISNHKSASPNSAIFYILHAYRIINGNRIFLQHGITMNNVDYLHYSKTNFELFVCGAVQEYKYVSENFGYPRDRVAKLGFPRFDSLIDESNKNQIVIMPTWREWLGRSVNGFGKAYDFIQSNYYKTYQSLLNDSDFCSLLERKDAVVYFYLHANMQRYTQEFTTVSKRIKIVDQNSYDIRMLLRESRVMVSDYSSVTIDFAYMSKPVIYYQFDETEYRRRHNAAGYFSYANNGFGPITKTAKTTVQQLEKYINSDYKVEYKYMANGDKFFGVKDQKNSDRVFNKIIEMESNIGSKK